MAHHSPMHQPSLPAFSHISFPVDLAAIPASTRTSYTRVDMSRPVTSAGPGSDPIFDGDDDALALRIDVRPHTTTAADGRFVRIDDDKTSTYSAPVDQDARDLDPQESVDVSPPVPQTPQSSVTFLLVSGRRRTMLFEPETTVGRVKELLWNTWPNDWQDERPPAPSYFRLLHLGKVLQDEDTLTRLNFVSHVPTSPSAPAPRPVPTTIVHLSIRSYAPPLDDPLKKKKRSWGRSASTSSAGANAEPDVDGCMCCVVC
ncbi:ubiquitin-related domain-containing protein [Amylostereum chailletii]|nr:ubiquitin-related domain-containing protein [Amylostereum chailletii]